MLNIVWTPSTAGTKNYESLTVHKGSIQGKSKEVLAFEHQHVKGGNFWTPARQRRYPLKARTSKGVPFEHQHIKGGNLWTLARQRRYPLNASTSKEVTFNFGTQARQKGTLGTITSNEVGTFGTLTCVRKNSRLTSKPNEFTLAH